MAEQNGQPKSPRAMWIVPLAALAIIVVLAIAWRMFYIHTHKVVIIQPEPKPNTITQEANGLVSIPAATPPTIISKEAVTEPAIKTKVTIEDVIKIRQYWNPAFTDWIGKEAPNFDLADITGANHKLSEYKGKTLMLVFWATWCGPCKEEIPGLIQLRKQFPPEKLAIVAISFEKGDVVRGFLKQTPVNYTVIATPQYILPPPFIGVNGIPATFFIDKDGIIRLATEGLVLPDEVKLVLKAI